MKKSRKKQKRGALTDKELRRYVIFLTIPCLLLVLLIVVLIFGEGKSLDPGTENTSAKAASTVAGSADIPVIEPDTKEYIQDFGGSILEQDKVPEINYLMERYFLSMSSCDMETFMQLFSSRDTGQTDVFRERFEKQKEYIEGYQNISCYTTGGLETDSYVAYVYYDKKFVNVDTLCPAMVRVCVVKCDDGQYRIYDEAVSAELEEYLEQISRNEDVQLLSTMVDRKLKEAEGQDPELEKRIAYLKKGPDYMQEDESTQAQETAE